MRGRGLRSLSHGGASCFAASRPGFWARVHGAGRLDGLRQTNSPKSRSSGPWKHFLCKHFLESPRNAGGGGLGGRAGHSEELFPHPSLPAACMVSPKEPAPCPPPPQFLSPALSPNSICEVKWSLAYKAKDCFWTLAGYYFNSPHPNVLPIFGESTGQRPFACFLIDPPRRKDSSLSWGCGLSRLIRSAAPGELRCTHHRWTRNVSPYTFLDEQPTVCSRVSYLGAFAVPGR